MKGSKILTLENFAARAGPVCPCNVKSNRPSRISQTRREESFEEVRMYCPLCKEKLGKINHNPDKNNIEEKYIANLQGAWTCP
jgi:uncharacterized protein with PIN domain